MLNCKVFLYSCDLYLQKTQIVMIILHGEKIWRTRASVQDHIKIQQKYKWRTWEFYVSFVITGNLLRPMPNDWARRTTALIMKRISEYYNRR